MMLVRSTILSLLLIPHISFAWDYSGHRMVAAVAVDSLPDDFPLFARSAAAGDRIMFLSGEADRWRNLQDPELRHCNELDHYCDLEELSKYGLTPETLSPFRYETVGKIYVDRAVHPEFFASEDLGEDTAKVYVQFGLLPYSIHDHYLKLKSAFKSLRDLEVNGGNPDDIAQIQQNIIYIMGVMSHYVGDGAQPLHLSKHHHGWVGDNPNNYTTNRKIHSWIDGGFIASAGITYEGISNRVTPAKLIWPEKTDLAEATAFPFIMHYLSGTFVEVEPLYMLYKENKLLEFEPSAEGCTFIENQLLRGGQFLGDLYYSAYRTSIAQ
jgi:hypothetical protein